MTTTDYSLLAASAAIILTVAACWWRRASETARIHVTRSRRSAARMNPGAE